MDKQILLVSNYFPPEKGAAASRIYSLAIALSKSGYKVQVVCPFPNYPTGKIFKNFRNSLYRKTVENEITIHRLWVWPSNSSNKFFRLLSMLSFSVSLKFFLLFKKIPKITLIQYSPVFVGFTAVVWAWLFRKKIILNISDLWPLAGLEMGLLKKGFYYSVLERMERFCCKKASLILGQSEEILTHVQAMGVKGDSFLYRNYPDFNPIEISEGTSARKIRLVYAGLLGVAQGLYGICLSITFPEHLEFHIYGAGPEADKISGLNNPQIIFHGEISREQLHHEIAQYDLGFIPLINRIYGSVPSKIFEYSKLGLPILYYAGGEGERLVSELNLGWSIPVNNFAELQQFISSLSLERLENISKKVVQATARKTFNFQRQFENLIKKIETI